MKIERRKHMKTRFIFKRAAALCMVFVMMVCCLPTAVFAAPDGAAPEDALTVSAPDVDLNINIWLQNGQPYYSIDFKGEEMVGASRMGLDTSLGSLSSGFTGIEEVSSDSLDETWTPITGEKDTIVDKYNEKVFELTNENGLSLSIEMRAYNTGVAFRYLLPDAGELGDYVINDEQTRFALAKQGDVVYHRNGQQTAATRSDINGISGTVYPPLTAEFDDGTAMTIAVAKVDNYIYPLLERNSEGLLKPRTMTGDRQVSVNEEGPYASPYWTFVIGESLSDLPNNKDIILNLNDKPDEEKYNFSEWVKPGKALMMGLFNETTESMKLQIDTAKKCGIDYLLMDFGWYGPEFYRYSDPRLDPSKLVEDPNDSEEVANAKAFMRQYVTEYGVFNATGKPFNVYLDCPWGGNIQMAPNLNIPEIVKYAKSQGVGIFLYVNNVQLFDQLGRYDLDELLSTFASWGVVGIKPGFVANKSQAGETSTRELIEVAAKYHLMLTVHDDWIQSGIEREFPNLLNAEGVYGDEGLSTGNIEGDLNALFARGIQGYADHTTCYPGKATRGYQLATAVLWPSALNCIYWPWRNTDTGNRASIESLPEAERAFWKDMPSTWDELHIISAELSETAATARRTGDEWYMGAISAVEQDLRLPLDFLDEGVEYVATLYQDREGNDAYNSNRDNRTESAELLISTVKVDSDTVIARQMKYGTGLTAYIRPATAEDADVPEYSDVIRAEFEALIEEAAQALEAKLPENYPNANEEANRIFAEAIDAATEINNNPDSTDTQFLEAKDALDVAMSEFRRSYEIVSLDKSSLTLTVGGTEKLNVTVELEDPNDKNVTWTSSDPSVVDVDGNGNLLALGAGKATVTVAAVNGGKSDACEVTVEASDNVAFIRTDCDSTIQSWKAWNADEQTRNYGGIDVMRLLSNRSGNYGKYGQDPSSVNANEVDVKIGLMKFDIPEGKKIASARLFVTGNGVKSGVSGNDSIEAVRITTNEWTEGNSSGGSDVPFENITDDVTYKHLAEGLNYQLGFDFSTNCVSDEFSTSNFSGKRIEIDVTDIVNKAEDGVVSIALFETQGKEIYLNSSENGSTSGRPFIIVEFEDEKISSFDKVTEDPINTNERFTVEVVTSDDVAKISFVNENGKDIGKTLVRMTDNDDGTITWEYSMAVGTAGADREFTAKAYDASGAFLGEKSAVFTILREQAKVVSFNRVSDEPVYANEAFEIEIVTSSSVDSIKLQNELERIIGKTLVSKTSANGVITWKFSLSMGTPGEDRQINVVLIDKDNNVIENAGQIVFDILKPEEV